MAQNLAGFGLFLITLYLLTSTVLATYLLLPQRRALPSTPNDVGLAFTDVEILSRDTLTLAGWYIPGGQPAVLMVHGVNTNRALEFQGRFLDLARDLHAAGYTVLMVDLPGHGESAGRLFTLAHREQHDVSAAVGWLAARGHEKIGVLGVSFGGMASAEASAHDARIAALALDSVYPDLRPHIGLGPLPDWLLPGTLLMMRVIYRVDADAVRPALHTGPAGTPLLVMYGEADPLIPAEERLLFQQANPDATTWMVPTARHATLYRTVPDEYLARLLAFFERHLR